MIQSTNRESVDVCTTLLFALSSKGFKPEEIHQLVKDVYDLIKDGGQFTLQIINHELENSGWTPNTIDDSILQLILMFFETSFEFKVNTRYLH